MNVKIICGAAHAYACISTDKFSLDVQLPHGKGAADGLRQRAEEFYEQARRYAERAARCEQAAEMVAPNAANGAVEAC